MEAKSPLPNTAARMETVKAAWDKAPAGPKKDAALKHYQAAQKAMTASTMAIATASLTPRRKRWLNLLSP